MPHMDWYNPMSAKLSFDLYADNKLTFRKRRKSNRKENISKKAGDMFWDT